MKLQAVVLTGSRDAHHPLLAGTGLSSKVLLPVRGRPMLSYVLDTLVASAYHPEIYVSGDDPAVRSASEAVPFRMLPNAGDAVGSVLKALESLPDAGRVLFVSGDHPLLTPAMLDYFMDEALRRDLTFAVALVSRDEVRRHHPQSRRTYFFAKGGAYSGGNLMLLDKRRFHGHIAFMEAIDRNRKAPWKNLGMLAKLDPLAALRILLRQEDIHGVARQASRLFGCETGVVEMPFAECCMDVDKPSDQAMAEAILGQREEMPEAASHRRRRQYF